MNEDELHILCKSLANRYRSKDQYEDLVSEGMLACYECREAGKETRADFVGSARRAMNDYVNLKVKTVSIPCTWTSRAASSAVSEGECLESLEGVSVVTLSSLMDAVSNRTEPLDNDTIFTDDHAIAYEAKDYRDHLISVAKLSLTPTELAIIKMRYFQDMTQDEVGEVLEANKMWVSRHEKTALLKLQEGLM
jgi:RNA polymerase sigma factor (sigma-70 family)